MSTTALHDSPLVRAWQRMRTLLLARPWMGTETLIVGACLYFSLFANGVFWRAAAPQPLTQWQWALSLFLLVTAANGVWLTLLVWRRTARVVLSLLVVTSALAGHYMAAYGIYIDADMIHDAIRRRSSFNLVHLATMMKVDVFIVKARPFDRVAFARVTTAPLDANERSFPLTTAEDIVLHKLEWFVLGGGMSERQWHDILGVLQVQANLDRAYLDRWATDLGVADLLARAFREAEPR